MDAAHARIQRRVRVRSFPLHARCFPTPLPALSFPFPPARCWAWAEAEACWRTPRRLRLHWSRFAMVSQSLSLSVSLIPPMSPLSLSFRKGLHQEPPHPHAWSPACCSRVTTKHPATSGRLAPSGHRERCSAPLTAPLWSEDLSSEYGTYKAVKARF